MAVPGVGPYRALNPTTKLTIAFAEAIVAFSVRGWTAPLVILVLVIGCIAWAGVTSGLLPYVLATLPLVVSILIINTLLYPGATDPIGTIGPFTVTWSGLTAGLQATLRVLAFASSVALFALTTTTDQLVSDLERRGLGRRATFVISAAIGTVPGIVERARAITDAQRARGLDTEGRIWRRVRGLVPLAAPVVVGALTEVEEKAMALEARAFAAPGRRTILRPHPDSSGQRVFRWLLVGGTGAILLGVVSGALSRVP